VFEASGRRRDGTDVPIELSIAEWRTPEGHFATAIIRDITARVAADQLLRESEAHYRSLVDGVPGIIYSFSNLRGGLFYSSRTADILGYPPEHLLADPMLWNRSIHPDDLPLVDASVAASGVEGPFVVEYRIRDARGDWRWFEDRLLASTSIGGEVVIEGLALDITERKAAEAALREGDARYEELATRIPIGVGIYLNNAAGEVAFEYMSEPGGRILGVDPAAVVADPWQAFARLAPDEMARLMRLGEERRAVNERFTWEGDFLVDGEARRVRLDAEPAPGPDGWTRWHFIIEDVTERRAAEAQQVALEAQLAQAQKMESVGRLAGGVAHDFNNMLAAILGNTELALEALDPASPATSNLLEIQQAARRSADLTRQLLAFARRQTIAPRVLDLNEAVGGMLDMLRRLIRAGVGLVWKPGGDLWAVQMDPSQLDQVLTNLVVNAGDAVGDIGMVTLETGNATLDADACATRPGALPGEYAVLTVSDNGSGMDTETMSHLFEPFFTTKESGKGTGLGLATVYGIVSQSGGFINAHSEPGTGSTFRVYLPRHRTRAVPSAEPTPQIASHGGGETVLLVEDEPAILRLGTVMLERLGYRVVAAATPGEAIRLAREHAGEIDLLMTDVVMPEMNGRDLARNLLSLYPRIGRLYMSGYTADVIADHGVLEEGVHFLHKPFSAQDLAAKVREALGQDPVSSDASAG
jgi:PAS domain S-box-containing protein